MARAERIRAGQGHPRVVLMKAGELAAMASARAIYCREARARASADAPDGESVRPFLTQ